MRRTRSILAAGGRQPAGSTYQAAIDASGQDGGGELVYLVGGYCLVSALPSKRPRTATTR